MDTKVATRQIRIQQWAAIIKDCKASNLKVDDYCREHDISRDAYYYWLRKVKEAALLQSGFVEFDLPANGKQFSSAALTARIRDVSLDIQEGVSQELLEKVIRGIRNA